MKNKEKQNLKSFIKSISSKKEGGITLVALVVTIIILLILAGVAINMALGDNGLFKRSREAVNTWKSAEENETGALDYLDREWDNLINGGTSTGNPPTSNETRIVKIGNEEVAVPGGFTIVGTEDSTAGQTVADGIVVKDPQGNEWVWVPCYVEGGKGSNIAGKIKYDRYIFGDQAFDEEDNSKIYSDSSKKNYYHEALSATSKEYLSIKKYGGYYIGRYEAGDKESTTAGIMRGREGSTINTSGDATHTVTIQKNQVPYNYVTQAQCKTLSEGMTSADGNNKNKLNGTQVFTKLCSSYSWDTALMFIQQTHSTYGSDSKTKDGILADQFYSNKYGNGKLFTGKTLPVCSIYDMGGNVSEYTTECYPNEYFECVNRGRSYNIVSDRNSPGYRYSYGSSGPAYDDIAFRPTLFVK